jgi:hypothetical protein
MKQYAIIKFGYTEEPGYYHSKNAIIQALNEGCYSLSNKGTLKEVKNTLQTWAGNHFTFIAKVSQDLEQVHPGNLISIEKIFYDTYTVNNNCVKTTEVELNFIPPIAIFKPEKVKWGETPKSTSALIQKRSYADLLNACGTFRLPPVITQEIASYIGDSSYPLKEGDGPYPEDVVIHKTYL